MKVTVYPLAGRLVRDPQTLVPLPAEGQEVDWGTHWMRREADGDISRVMPATQAAPEPAPTPAAPPPAAPKGSSNKKAR